MNSEVDAIQVAEHRIAWVLAHPDMSPWLQETLRTARERDPVAVMNDLELLDALLRPWADARIQEMMETIAR